MATIQEQLKSGLVDLAASVAEGRYGKGNDIDEESFKDDFDELRDDIETALERLS